MNQLDWLPAWFTAMFKFGVKGGAGLLLNIGLLTVLVDFGGIPAQWAIFVAWGLTVVPGYLVTDLWVFSIFPSPDGTISHGQRGTLFYAIMWSGKGLNYLIYIALIELGLFYQAAWFVGAVAVFPLIFGVNYWLWKRNPTGWGDALGLLTDST